MILPIVLYGNPVLRKKCVDIKPDYEGLKQLIEDIWETIYSSNGVGIAAPQINKAIRLFVIDSEIIVHEFDEEEKIKFGNEKPIKQVFINAELIKEYGNKLVINEGCLSIPFIREKVERYNTITLKYLDENFVEHIETFEGITARVIQHEYDHIEGKLFIDRISSLKRKLLKGKLDDISKNKIYTDYKMLQNR